jgi:hypothetical protein
MNGTGGDGEPPIAAGPQAREPSREAALPGRHKLWELDRGSHCSIIGTCLSLDELRRLLRKADLTIAPDTLDYDIHGFFVTRSGSRSLLSKLTHKTLDRKYAAQIARFRRAASADALWQLWRQAMTEGDVAGAYWALMTHKATPLAMAIRAHNEVHMLSHMMGKSARDDIKRLRDVETAHAALAERLAKTQTRAQAARQQRDERIRALEAQLIIAAAVADRSQELRKRDAEIARLQARCDGLERRLQAERKRADAAAARVSALAEKPVPRPQPSATVIDEPATDEADDGRGRDLSGYALLYVGGYQDVTPRLRAHVEAMRGVFSITTAVSNGRMGN